MRYCPEKLNVLPRIGLVTALALGSVASAENIDAPGSAEQEQQEVIIYPETLLDTAGEMRLARIMINETIDYACTPERALNTQSCEPVENNEDSIARQAEVQAAAKTEEIRKAEPVEPVKQEYPVGCEQYRPLVEQYDWSADAAMRVMKEESGCDPNAVSPTDDHGLMQLHKRPIYDPAENIAVAYELYEDGRVGENNWSAWYAVCTPGNNPQPKFPGINCQ